MKKYILFLLASAQLTSAAVLQLWPCGETGQTFAITTPVDIPIGPSAWVSFRPTSDGLAVDGKGLTFASHYGRPAVPYVDGRLIDPEGDFTPTIELLPTGRPYEWVGQSLALRLDDGLAAWLRLDISGGWLTITDAGLSTSPGKIPAGQVPEPGLLPLLGLALAFCGRRSR